MKDFTLEDMTKPELIKIIKQSLAYQPTQKVMQWIRWESIGMKLSDKADSFFEEIKGQRQRE